MPFFSFFFLTKKTRGACILSICAESCRRIWFIWIVLCLMLRADQLATPWSSCKVTVILISLQLQYLHRCVTCCSDKCLIRKLLCNFSMSGMYQLRWHRRVISSVFILFDKPHTYSVSEIEWKILSSRMREVVSLNILGFRAFRSGVQSRKYITAIICRLREQKRRNYSCVFFCARLLCSLLA